MKFTIFFLACFIGVSYQQNYFTTWPVMKNNGAFFYHPYYLQPLMNEKEIQPVNDNFKAEQNKYQLEPSKPDAQIKQQSTQSSSDSILSGIVNYLINNPSIDVSTLVVTQYSTVNLTGTLVTFQPCLPSSLFDTTSDSSGSLVLLTQPCRRKRDYSRDITAQFSDVSPTQVLPLEETAAPVVVLEDQSTIPYTDFQSLMTSSQVPDENQLSFNPKLIAPYKVTFTSATTLPYTTYYLSSTVIQKTIKLFSDGYTSALQCMLQNHVLCTTS